MLAGPYGGGILPSVYHGFYLKLNKLLKQWIFNIYQFKASLLPWLEVIGFNMQKCFIFTNWTTSELEEMWFGDVLRSCALQKIWPTAITDRLLKLPTVMPQFPNCKNEKKRKNHYIFTREIILKFNMTVINTIQNSLNKEQILSSEHHMVRKTWSHALNRRNGAHWVLSVLYRGGRNLIITFSDFITCTAFSFSILLKFHLHRKSFSQNVLKS